MPNYLARVAAASLGTPALAARLPATPPLHSMSAGMPPAPDIDAHADVVPEGAQASPVPHAVPGLEPPAPVAGSTTPTVAASARPIPSMPTPREHPSAHVADAPASRPGVTDGDAHGDAPANHVAGPEVGASAPGVPDAVQHLVLAPRSLRPRLPPALAGTGDGTGAGAPDPVLGTLATLLASPVVDAAPAAPVTPATPAMEAPQRDPRTAVAQAPSALVALPSQQGEAAGAPRPVEVELAADDSQRPAGSRRAAADWRIQVGRVEVNVENRTPPPIAPAPARAEPLTLASDPLEARFLERFRYRL